MKRKDLINYILDHGCRFIREGASHSVFFNPKTNLISTIPRHREIDSFLAQKICKDLGVPKPKKR